jgi:cytochrome c oxidase subunit 1
MFVSGMNLLLSATFSFSTMLIAVPSAIKTFNWMGTVWGGSVRFTTAMCFALAFVSMFVIGGLSGIYMAATPVDIFIHHTYFIVAHIHYVLFGGSLFGVFGGIYFWFPKMFGRMMNERWGQLHFFLTLAGTYAIFMPMHYLGLAGQTRRYSQFTEVAYQTKLVPLQTFMTYAAFITIAAQFIFVVNLFWSMKKGAKATENPWEATTLEWTTATPPPHDNFGGRIPVVHHGPYEYSVPGAPRDYVMQTDPVTVKAH